MPRLPKDAFERFLALGPARSYARLASELGVSKRSMTARASKEGWQAQFARIESEAKRRTGERAIEDMQSIDDRHLRVTRAIQARALEALKAMPINTAMAAVRALDVAVKLERAVVGRDKAEPKGPTLEDVLIEARRRREAREAQESAAKPTAPDSIPPALAPRICGEN